MRRMVILNYKSGNSTHSILTESIEELTRKIKYSEIDLDPETFSMIKWGEVESIVPQERRS